MYGVGIFIIFTDKETNVWETPYLIGVELGYDKVSSLTVAFTLPTPLLYGLSITVSYSKEYINAW